MLLFCFDAFNIQCFCHYQTIELVLEPTLIVVTPIQAFLSQPTYRKRQLTIQLLMHNTAVYNM